MHTTKNRISSLLVRSAVLITICIAVLLLITSLFHIPYMEHILTGYQAINRYVQRFIALVVLILSVNLAQRKRTAWLGVVVLTFLSLFSHFVLHHTYFNIIIIMCEIYVLAILCIFHQDFSRQGKKLSLKQTILLCAVGLAALIVNAVFELYLLHQTSNSTVSFGQMLLKTGEALFGGTSTEGSHQVFEAFLVTLFWAVVLASLLLILRAATLVRTITQNEKAKARELVTKYGQNPSSYLTLEDDKQLFFSNLTEGVIAYGIVGSVIVVNGDPICPPASFNQLLTEFQLFCHAGNYQCIFLSTTQAFLENYTALGFSHVKCGEEARFTLQELSLAGGKSAKLRANINHANKAGLTTFEYKPLTEKNLQVEQEIEDVSNAWLAGKHNSQLAFTIGGIGLDDPLDRRYFYARNPEGQMVAFNVYLPFGGMAGYMADVTRRRPDAPSGVTEKIIYDAFMVFKEEGLLWGSMGLAPLSNIHEEGVPDSTTEKILEMIYNKFNSFYGFKDLRMAKEHYSPSTWEPGYFVYSTTNITPQMAYAVVKIQNPGGIHDYIKGFFKGLFKGHKKAHHS